VLTAYAESDFKWDARSKNPTSSGHYSEGAFQQTLPWWPNDHFDVAASTNAFLDNIRNVGNDFLWSCWNVQRWAAPDPARDYMGFLNAKETRNYQDRIIGNGFKSVAAIIRERRVV